MSLHPLTSVGLVSMFIVGLAEISAYLAAPGSYAHLALIGAGLDRTLTVPAGVRERLQGLRLEGADYVAGWRPDPSYAWLRLTLKLGWNSSLAIGRVDVRVLPALRSAFDDDASPVERVEIRAWWIPFPTGLYAVMFGLLVLFALAFSLKVLGLAAAAGILCAFDATMAHRRMRKALEAAVDRIETALRSETPPA